MEPEWIPSGSRVVHPSFCILSTYDSFTGPYFDDPTNNIKYEEQVFCTLGGKKLVIKDFDNDGDEDIGCFDWENGSLSYIRNNGNGFDLSGSNFEEITVFSNW